MCNILLYYIDFIIILYSYGPPLYMRSVVDRNVVMRRIPVHYYRVYHLQDLVYIGTTIFRSMTNIYVSKSALHSAAECQLKALVP